jgi:23S rRNA-/tRNA-specific pseudouridylate synthase
MLAGYFASASYIPAPAHRLDRRSSGLLLAALSHAQAIRLQRLFAEGEIRKYYLAWVFGRPSWKKPLLLEDKLDTGFLAGRELMRVKPESGAAEKTAEPATQETGEKSEADKTQGKKREGKKASCAALVLRCLEAGPPGFPVPAALLMLRLLSGRKHQLRVQLAARGLPVIGDALHGRILNAQEEIENNRHGGQGEGKNNKRISAPHFPDLLLHAHFLSLPERTPEEREDSGLDPTLCPGYREQARSGQNVARREFILPPPWPADLLPDEKNLPKARAALDACIAARVQF